MTMVKENSARVMHMQNFPLTGGGVEPMVTFDLSFLLWVNSGVTRFSL